MMTITGSASYIHFISFGTLAFWFLYLISNRKLKKKIWTGQSATPFRWPPGVTRSPSCSHSTRPWNEEDLFGSFRVHTDKIQFVTITTKSRTNTCAL